MRRAYERVRARKLSMLFSKARESDQRHPGTFSEPKRGIKSCRENSEQRKVLDPATRECILYPFSALTMAERAFKFKSPVITMRSEGGQRGIVIIPANAIVTVVEAVITGTEKFVKVRYQDQTLNMFVTDLCSRGEPVQQIGKSMWG